MPEGSPDDEQNPAPEIPSQTVKQSSGEFPLPKGVVIPFLVVVSIGVLSFIYFKSGKPVPKIQFLLPAWNAIVPKMLKPKDHAAVSKPKTLEDIKSLLTDKDRAELTQPLQLTIPRPLDEDEEAILKKQVSSPAQLVQKPKLSAWKKKDFEAMLENDQKKRKIYMGWAYNRSLVKTFDDNYPKAMEAFEHGDYILARDLFFKSLSFPVYRNEVQFHRAVALVILRPYVNDVIAKIATLNQYLLSQSLLIDVRSLSQSYEGLFAVLELHEWERAFQIIGELKKQIDALENRPQGAEVVYPPSFNALDAELQGAIRSEASPKPEGAVDLKALKIDLELKEKAVHQNTTEELLKIQKQCEEISRLLVEGNLEQALDRLRDIEYPAEVADQARKKIAFIEKAFALEQSKKK